MKPHTSYLICSTCRSGSNLLCEILGKTQVLGKPSDVFNGIWAASRYEIDIKSRTTPNGVFGMKILLHSFKRFFNNLRQAPEFKDKDMPLPKLLSYAYPNLHYIWLVRCNKVRQAVSLLKANQTRCFRSDCPPPPMGEPIFDFDEIDLIVQKLVMMDATWQDYFYENGVAPLIIVYEDFIHKYEETVQQVIRYLNIPPPSNFILGKIKLHKQADMLSGKWVEKYKECKQQRLGELDYLKPWYSNRSVN